VFSGIWYGRSMAQPIPELMNTRQVARYLGINEKKVYALAKARKIPCTRVTGKWTFPRKLIDSWIEQSAIQPQTRDLRQEQRPFLLAAGSDDPSLGILRELFEQQTKPASFFLNTIGSSGGVVAVRDGAADLATSHILDAATGEYNLPFISKLLGTGTVVVQLFHRQLGLVIARGNPLKLRAVGDLARRKVRMINRQAGSGTRLYLDQTLARLKINPRKLNGYEATVATHLEVGSKVLRGEVDTGLATMTTAQMLGLDFVPLARERFDAVIAQERFFSPAIRILLSVVGSREFRGRLEAMGGYDSGESGRIMHIT
jgi:putative molybdopterin biosynthesis protein